MGWSFSTKTGVLEPPGSHSEPWAARMAAIRLSGSHRQEVTDWLVAVANKRPSDPTRCAAVVDVLLSMAGPGFEEALLIAAHHPRDEIIHRRFMRALEGTDPSDPILESCANTFLNSLVPENQSEESPVDPGGNPISSDLIALSRMLSDGADEQNAKSRIHLLLLKLKRIPSRFGNFSPFPLGRDHELPISSLAEDDPDEHFGEPRHIAEGCLVSIMAKAMAWLPGGGTAGADRKGTG